MPNKKCIKCKVVLIPNVNWLNYLIPRSNYICTPCFKEYGKKYYANSINTIVNINTSTNTTHQNIKTPNAKNQQQRAKTLQKYRYLRIKQEVINKYGGKCNNCNINDLDVLTIDHLNNNGHQHRKEINNIYRWLKNNSYPDGYTTLCFNCNCSKMFYKNNKYKLKNYDLINKQNVINHYGKKCNQCNEDSIEKLTIDHINNDGAEHRRKTNCGTGQMIYRWIIKNNYPNIFQVLCFNCNCKKRSVKLNDNDIIILLPALE